jgi:hypothetical protein
MTIPPPQPIGTEISSRGPDYFDNVVFDNLIDALLELSAEVWVCRDRQLVLEAALKSHGIDAAALIEAHQPTPEEAAQRKAAREAFTQRLFGSFLRRPDGGYTGSRA